MLDHLVRESMEDGVPQIGDVGSLGVQLDDKVVNALREWQVLANGSRKRLCLDGYFLCEASVAVTPDGINPRSIAHGQSLTIWH
jgi:hypothetical protein